MSQHDAALDFIKDQLTRIESKVDTLDGRMRDVERTLVTDADMEN